MNEYTKIFKALGDETRLRIIKMLEVKKMCVCEITSIIGSSAPTISNHLKILKEAGLIEQDRDEKYMNYSIVENKNEFIKNLLELIENIDESQSRSDKETAVRTDRAHIC
ncbi:MAG: metalloregulator ArsR/SmtB family transcription factor [Candidatus Delongbacteria bacterium]|nr:metalloregulator ArsR/SmtB family transcription factor [Candidatus Delongbacteria bacterium]MCG2760432.1 metalloregulator ArsR/SmtB family transcription factor [Candidatus Delongbacteria bacterium]